jgi:sugar lactone lactonase YvrE
MPCIARSTAAVSTSLFVSKRSYGRLRVPALLLLGCIFFLAARSSQAAVAVFPGTTAVGVTSAPLGVQVAISKSGSLNAVKVLTTGIANLDFNASGTATCSAGNSYAIGQICTFPVTFQPKYPGQRLGAVVLLDASGTVLGATALVGNASGPLAMFVPGTINTVAGNAAWIYRGDGLTATASSIFLPFGIAVDSGGSLYIADSSNDRIRKVDAATNLMSTVAGNGSVGASGDGGAATLASVNMPSSVTIDGAGNIYFADSANNAVRKVEASTGIITTVAGTLGVQGYGGDGAAATSALLNNPDGIALDGYGALYIADTGNNIVRKLDLSSGIISVFAGNRTTGYSGDGGSATSATLNSPWSLTVSAAGDVYIADQNNHAIRKVTSGIISTVSGSGTPGFSGDGGPASAATLNSPSSVAVDVAGNIYVADTGNNRVRKINAATAVITTVAGNGTETFSGDGGAADNAGMYGPYGLVIDGAGDLFIADVFHNRIRMISSTNAQLSYPTMRVNRVSATQNETLENDGNAPLNFTSILPVTNAQLDSSVTTCSILQPVAIALNCVIGAQFAPTVIGNPVLGSISLVSDSQNSPQTIKLSGQVLTLDPTTGVLITSASPSALGAPVTFTATFSSTGIKPTGTVTFLDGSTSIGTGALNASGVATLTTATLTLGTHSITASYPGDANNSPSVSNAVSQVVKNGTTVSLQSNPNPSSAKSAVTLTATAIGVNGTPTGTMTFLDNTASPATTLGTATLDASGTATFTISTLSVGTHKLTASYGGDSSDLANVSPQLSQVVSKSSTTTSVTTSNASSTFSTSVTFTATVVSQTAGPATGTVTFKDGSATLGTGTLSSGTATFSTTALAVGSHNITASYGGDTNNSTSTSALLSQTVVQIATSVALTSDANPSAAGANVHLTATITAALNPSTDPLTGSVVFTDGTATLGTSNVAAGVATLDVAALSIGQHSIVATYSGATDYAGSASSPLSQKVQLSPTTGTLVPSANPAVAGKPITLTATVTSAGAMPTGSITFKDGSANIGLGTLNAQGVATFTTSSLSAGTHALTAVYAGDTNSQPVTSSLSLVISQATTGVVITSSASPVTVGLPVTLHATATGNGATPSGTIGFFDGATLLGSVQLDVNGLASIVLSTLGVGSHSITGVYSGDTNDAQSTSPIFVQVVDKTLTATTLTSTSATVSQGTSVQFAAQVSSNAGIPGGTVSFYDGTTLIGTATVNAAGVAVYNVTGLLVGQHNIVAVYSGDTNNSPSTSTSFTQIIQPITIVGLTSDHNPSSTGALLTFTAGVSGANTIPTGTVTFKDGSSIIGVSTLNGAGVATLSTTALSAGPHLITAAYAGDGNNTASVSSVYTQTIQQATTQTVLALTSATANYGASVRMTATVTGSGGLPGGEVNFVDGSTVLGTGHLNSAGVASFSTSSLSLGQHNLTAVYNGDTNDETSTSASQILTIQKDTVSITATSSNNPSLGGLAVSFTATLQANTNVPTGTVDWNDGAVLLGTTPVSGNATSSFTTATLTPGQHTITAIYSGDATNASATSAPLIETIQQAASAITFSSNKNPGLAGDAISFSFAVTGTGGQPGGTVVLKDAGVAIGSATLDASGLASITTSSLAVGSHQLVASYAGDSFHAGSQSLPIEEIILRGTSSTLVSTKNPSLAGESITFTATILGSGTTAITGNVVFRDGAITLTTTPVTSAGVATYTTSTQSPGDHSITATYSGDSLNQQSITPVLVQTIQTVNTTTTLASTISAATVGSDITLTATVAGSGPTPTGSVKFMDGATLLGTGSIAAGGVAVFTTATLAPGQHILIAIYGGDTDHVTSTSNPLVQSVLQRTTTAVVSVTNPSYAANATVFNVSVGNAAGTALPTGSVHLMDGTTTLASAVLDTTTASASFTIPSLAVGQHAITAVYDGDTQNFASTSPVLTQTVRLHPTTTVLAASSTSLTQGLQLTLTATISTGGITPPSGKVVFTAGSSTLGTANLNASGIASLTITPDLGTFNIVATYQGDSIYAGSASSATTVNVNELTHFTVTLNPATLSLQTKQHSTIKLTLKSIQGFTDVIALGCVGLPNAATCTFSANQVTLAADGTQTVDLVVDTGSPLTAGGVATSSLSRSSNVAMCLLPGGLLFAFVFRRSRRASRALSGLLAILIFAISMAVSGCGTLDIHGTPGGSYTINVTAIGNKTTETQSSALALTVKQ